MFSDTVKVTAVVQPPFCPLYSKSIYFTVLTFLTVLLYDLNSMASDVLKKCVSLSQSMTLTDNSGWMKFNLISIGLILYVQSSVHIIRAEVC